MSDKELPVVTLTHATWVDEKEQPVEVYVQRDMIMAAFYHPNHAATMVIGPGNANLLVKEKPMKIMELRNFGANIRTNNKEKN